MAFKYIARGFRSVPRSLDKAILKPDGNGPLVRFEVLHTLSQLNCSLEVPDASDSSH